MYKIIVTNGSERELFYFDNARQTILLFDMAKNSKMFTRVEMQQWKEGYTPIKEWSSETEELDDG